MANFTPWGELSWVMSKIQGQTWGFIGCVAHEQRCLEAYQVLKGHNVQATFVRIFDEDPLDLDIEKASLDARTADPILTTIPSSRIIDADLLATVDTVEGIVERAVAGLSSVIVDITSFPKRWFFVIARLLKDNLALENIVYTYSLAEKYAQNLSSNPEIARTIPTFTSLDKRSSCDVALIGIGYHSQSVLNLFDIERPKTVAMLFPFPPGPPGIARNWRFVERLERSIRGDLENGLEEGNVGLLHLGALDLPQNFDALKQITKRGSRSSLVAPYGPKPVSLAMCLFALATEAAGLSEVPVYYSQPMRYALDYTTGIVEREGGRGTVYGYPVRLKSKDLYAI